MEPTRSREMPSCSAIGLAQIRRSSNFFNNATVVKILGHPERGAKQVEKSPRLNWATQIVTVANDGA